MRAFTAMHILRMTDGRAWESEEKKMRCYGRSKLLAAFILLPAMFASQSMATAGEADMTHRLAGTWSLVPDAARPDSPAARGIKVVHADGRFALIMTRPDSELAFTTAARTGGEDVPPSSGGIVEAAFGTYTLGPASDAITFHVDSSTFPNWEGVERRREFRLEGDRWIYSGPLPDWSGGHELVWRRLE
jgi:hypothetical protein